MEASRQHHRSLASSDWCLDIDAPNLAFNCYTPPDEPVDVYRPKNCDTEYGPFVVQGGDCSTHTGSSADQGIKNDEEKATVLQQDNPKQSVTIAQDHSNSYTGNTEEVLHA
ncbi:expressed unknown protein [Seminavis robusta]|uniref:Uncharacterized protein n=1 Tax=Seminavis robusta TaxID=568900 RepID=A0A9N8ETI2_9STRA|nr:expressed unknown protein [Seminavis robusta]|eukprot:Sro1585_g284100.1 n/a (111) ;mRNA; r:13104-13607